MNLNDLNFVPLDLPYANCDSNDIKQFIDARGKRTNYDWTKQINDPWNHVIIRSPSIVPKEHEIPGSGWTAEFRKKFPEVINVVELMPYKEINYVYILEQIIEVQPHFDVVSKNPNDFLEPATYRITLLLDDINTFYICNDNDCKKITHPVLPKETNSWVFSNKNYKHGSKLSSIKDARKILLAVSGKLNPTEHNLLINRSINKYREYVF